MKQRLTNERTEQKKGNGVGRVTTHSSAKTKIDKFPSRRGWQRGRHTHTHTTVNYMLCVATTKIVNCLWMSFHFRRCFWCGCRWCGNSYELCRNSCSLLFIDFVVPWTMRTPTLFHYKKKQLPTTRWLTVLWLELDITSKQLLKLPKKDIYIDGVLFKWMTLLKY